jgi:hypothetical protein
MYVYLSLHLCWSEIKWNLQLQSTNTRLRWIRGHQTHDIATFAQSFRALEDNAAPFDSHYQVSGPLPSGQHPPATSCSCSCSSARSPSLSRASASTLGQGGGGSSPTKPAPAAASASMLGQGGGVQRRGTEQRGSIRPTGSRPRAESDRAKAKRTARPVCPAGARSCHVQQQRRASQYTTVLAALRVVDWISTLQFHSRGVHAFVLDASTQLHMYVLVILLVVPAFVLGPRRHCTPGHWSLDAGAASAAGVG